MPCYSNLVRFDPLKLRINTRKEWYSNVESIETPDPHTVIFRLERPQPSLLSMLALVLDIQRRLEEGVAKPMLGWRNAYFARGPYVKNLVPHAPDYNFARMQDVWLDR
jgi:ABC-type transport system substrate-binding protein